MRTIRSAAVVLAISIIPIAAIAQNPETLTFTAAPMWLGLGGTDFTGFESGMGFELQARYRAGPERRGSLAVGYHQSRHQVGGVGVKVQGLFIEPRYALTPHPSTVVPFFTARLTSLVLRGPSAAVYGSAIGAGVALVIEASSWVQLEAAAALSLVFIPTTISYPRANGTDAMMRVGVGVNL